MSVVLVQMLGRAVEAGVAELRLSPGRRVVWVRGGVESEVGDKQSADGIDELIEPLLTPDARMDLALGRAEWSADVRGLGAVSVRAQLKGGETHAIFFLQGLGDSVPPTGAEPEHEEELVDLELESVAPGPVAAAQPLGRPSRPLGDEALPPVLGGGAGLNAAQKTALAQAQRQPAPREPARVSVVDDARLPVDTLPAPARAEIRATAPPVTTPSPTGSAREIQQLLSAVLQARGSDLHLSSGAPPMVRVDGDMRPMTSRGPLSAQAIEQIVWPIVPERARAEFARRRDADFAYELEGHARFRGNLFVDRNGIGVVFRAIPNQIVQVERLGLPPEILRMCQLPKGLVLVTGPTGSGKSTTLASLIDYVNRSRSGHIITIEDPVEFVFENKKCLVNQREVGTHTDSFRDALRAALREDPDVLLVGEMRDLETVEIALETAETGHLVFATLHTSSAAAAVDRIIDQFPADRQNQIRIMLAESLKCVVAQMLCRRVGGGRAAAFEVLFGVPAVANLIREKKVFQLSTVMQTGAKLGMRTMNDSLLDLVKRGVVTPDEALTKTQDRAALVAALKEAKIGA